MHGLAPFLWQRVNLQLVRYDHSRLVMWCATHVAEVVAAGNSMSILH